MPQGDAVRQSPTSVAEPCTSKQSVFRWCCVYVIDDQNRRDHLAGSYFQAELAFQSIEERNRTGGLGHISWFAGNCLDRASWAEVNGHVEPSGDTGGIGHGRRPREEAVQLLGKLGERHVAAGDQPRRERIG